MQTPRNQSTRRILPIPAVAMLSVGALVLALGVFATSCSDDDGGTADDRGDATSQDDTMGPDGLSDEAVSEQDMREAIADEMPTLDNSLLDAPPTGDWVDNISYNWVYSAMGDSMPDFQNEDLPPDGAERVGNDDKVVRMDKERGRIKYLSRVRAWTPDNAPQTLPIEPSQALTRIQNMMNGLEMPTGQTGNGSTDTEIVGAGNGEGGMESTYETYHLVRIPRVINDLPVLDSGIFAAVSPSDNEPTIQRALIKWPQFRLKPNAVLRSRQDVLDEAVQQIMQGIPLGDADQNVEARLVYAPAEEPLSEGGIGFLPAVQVSVLSPPTPYTVTVPVAAQ